MEYDLDTCVDKNCAYRAKDRVSVPISVILSTTETENVAMADGVKEALYVR